MQPALSYNISPSDIEEVFLDVDINSYEEYLAKVTALEEFVDEGNIAGAELLTYMALLYYIYDEAKMEKGMQYLLRSIELDPELHLTWLYLGRYYRVYNNLIDAKLWLDKLIKADPEYDVTAYNERGAIEPDFNKAMNYFEEGLVKFNDREAFDSHVAMYVFHNIDPDIDRSGIIDKILRTSPNNAYALVCKLSYLAKKEKDYLWVMKGIEKLEDKLLPKLRDPNTQSKPEETCDYQILFNMTALLKIRTLLKMQNYDEFIREILIYKKKAPIYDGMNMFEGMRETIIEKIRAEGIKDKNIERRLIKATED